MTSRLAPLLLLVLAVAAGAPAAAQASDAATPWIAVELDAIRAHATNPPRASRELAHLSVAMDLAARAGGAHADEAVAGAASTVLAFFHPDDSGRVDALADATAQRTSPWFLLGRGVGLLLVARAQHDGAGPPPAVSPPPGPGVWRPTPPAYVQQPIEPLAGTWRTWHLSDGAQLRPGPPPASGSPADLAEIREVFAVSRGLTDAQRRIAAFWADGAGTDTPPGHWNRIAVELVRAANWGTERAARLLSTLNTAQADAFIACWDAKYAFWRERPVTAIRRLIDPAWLPLLVTPPFPSYVSGHATTSGAASTVLAAFFPDRAAQLRAWAEEAAISRLYAGIHFRSDNEAGLALGRAVGRVALGDGRPGT
jgi:membrane-associated phospholipid phosphatase